MEFEIDNTNYQQKDANENNMIQIATKDDLERILELFDYVIKIHTDGSPNFFKSISPKEDNFHKNEINSLNDFLLSSSHRIYISKCNDEIVGFAKISSRICEGSGWNKRKYCFIYSIGVSKDHHKQGIGKELINAIKNFAKNNKCTQIELNVYEFNKNAISFYEHLGFKTFRRILGLEVI